MKMRTAVVVGAGPCGYVAVRRLREKLKPKDLRIVLITKDEYHYFPPLFADLALGEVELEEIRAPAKRIAELYDTEFVLGEVTGIDPQNKKVKVGNDEYSYDYLFLCTGVSYDFEKVPGLKEHGYHTYTLDGALKLKEALKDFNGGKVLLLAPEFPFRCAGLPFELAGKLLYLATKKGVDANVTITLPASKERIMQSMQEIPMTVGMIHQKYFPGKIEYKFGKVPKEVTENKVKFEDGSEEEYDLLIYMPPNRPPKFLASEEEFLCPNDKRWLVSTFPNFRHPKFNNIFVPTDAAMPCMRLPPVGVITHAAAVAAADSAIAEITGSGAPIPFPNQVPLVADLGPTGMMIVFEIIGKEGNVVKTKRYVSLTSPLIKSMKLSFYLGWIASLR